MVKWIITRSFYLLIPGSSPGTPVYKIYFKRLPSLFFCIYLSKATFSTVHIKNGEPSPLCYNDFIERGRHTPSHLHNTIGGIYYGKITSD
jgi:hypothetical protein